MLRLVKVAAVFVVVVLVIIAFLAWKFGGAGQLPFGYEGFDK